MAEIEFSMISDPPDGAHNLARILEEYEAQHGVRVRLSTMSWDQAWSNLVTFALYGKGPDVSHVGSTWGSSLAVMNALRPFAPREIAALGGSGAFIAAAWQSAVVAEHEQVWAMPWLADTYVVCYRRDLLKRAGVDERTAFGTAEAMAETLSRLQSVGVEIPWVISADPCPDVLHIVASWVWGAGTDFMNDNGTHCLFNQPKAVSGLKAYFELYRHLPSFARRLDARQSFDLFAEGRAAVMVVTSETALTIMRENIAPEVRDHLGTTVPPGVPWVGGDNLVIWRHTQGDPNRERAAIAFVSFLVSQRAQVRFCQTTEFLPVRFDALSALTFEPTSLAQTIDRAFRMGRPYKAIGMWTSVEYQLSRALDQVAADVMAEPTADVGAILHRHLDPLARRLDLTLSQ